MPDYNDIFAMACERKGGEKALKRLLQKPRSNASLKRLGDDRYLAEFSKKVFQSGFVWRVVEQKWDNFEDMFWSFDIDKLLMMPDDMLERKASDKRIIRNHRKVLAIRENALMISDTRRQHGASFSEFVAEWPTTDITGLWTYLKQHGTRLGGNTGPYALRSLGKDTFLLTRDVEGFLRLHDIIETGINTRSALLATQGWFNALQQESGRSLTELSQMVSFCFGDNRIGVNTA
jgi:3-methyladenine DNA glycosylase Tag